MPMLTSDQQIAILGLQRDLIAAQANQAMVNTQAQATVDQAQANLTAFLTDLASQGIDISGLQTAWSALTT